MIIITTANETQLITDNYCPHRPDSDSINGGKFRFGSHPSSDNHFVVPFHVLVIPLSSME